jgi:hypothetical protein
MLFFNQLSGALRQPTGDSILKLEDEIVAPLHIAL